MERVHERATMPRGGTRVDAGSCQLTLQATQIRVLLLDELLLTLAGCALGLESWPASCGLSKELLVLSFVQLPPTPSRDTEIGAKGGLRRCEPSGSREVKTTRWLAEAPRS